MTFAMVNVLPEPVTPRSVWYLAPLPISRTSCSIACGWSPAGLKSETNLNCIVEKYTVRVFFVTGVLTANYFHLFET